MTLSDSRLASLMSELKIRTRPQHEAIEKCIDVMRPDLTLGDYRSVIAGFYGFYAPVERRLAELHHARSLLPDFDHRLKTGKLRNDLEALGLDSEEIGSLPVCGDLPPLDTRPQAMGCLYVLEGATLGGQVISRHVIRTLGLSPDNGCAFFSSYGQELGTMWRRFGNEVSTYDKNLLERDEIVAAAQETFARFQVWLCT